LVLAEVRIRLLSPAIVTTRRTQSGFVRPADHIPGSMLRGAILSALYRDGKLTKEDLRREAERPTLLASPAYPLYRGARSLPATPYVLVCDECNGFEYIPPTEERPVKEYHECKGLPEAPQGVTGSGEQRHDRPMWLLKTLHGNLLASADGKPVRVRTETYRATSVAIDKRRRAAARGLLFDYEAIAEGTEFWAWVSVPDGIELDGLEVAVGRGQSRGFGRAVLSFWSELPREGGIQTDKWYVAISPVTPVRKLDWEGLGLSVVLERIEGRTYTLQTGWDVLQGRLRPFVEVARSGSLVVARLSDTSRSHFLRVGVPVKVDGFWLTGFNALIPLSEYESILEVKSWS